MPREATPSNFRSRAGTVGLVLGGHLVALLALLSAHPERDDGESADRMTLVFIDPLGQPRPADSPRRPLRTEARPHSAPLAVAPSPAADVAPNESTAISSGIDWYAQGSQAASRATAQPTTRSFENPKRGPAPRQKQHFAWDTTHTERVHALAGGGIGVHLSDNCELVIAPLPFAACALGKRKARGDLFDEMEAPPEMGDWKEE